MKLFTPNVTGKKPMIHFTAINKQNAAIRADGIGKVQPSGHGRMPQYSTAYHTCSWPCKFTRHLFLRKCLFLCCWGLAALIYWIIGLLAKATTLLNLESEAMCPSVRIFEKNLVSHKLIWLTVNFLRWQELLKSSYSVHRAIHGKQHDFTVSFYLFTGMF